MAGLFRAFITDLRRMGVYFTVACCVFAAGFVSGAMEPDLDAYLGQSIDALRDVAQTLGASNNPQLSFFVFIFLNNAVKSVAFVYFGALFAVVPLVVLAMNGMVLGYVMLHPAQEMPFFTLLVKGILPHGIIELPAVILACAYGIRLGVLMIRLIGTLFRPAERQALARAELAALMRVTLPLCAAVTLALLAAAVIESTITYNLMK